MTVLLTYRYRYEGPTENGWPQGKGKYTFPNGTVYEGYFDKGEFHGDGVLVYPKKVPKNIASSYNIIFQGKYIAKWDRGKMIEGKYYFYDELEYQKDSWTYCTLEDRQFYTEIKKGLRPDGLTLITNDIEGAKDIPEGTYDVGDGYYDPVRRAIFDYNDNILRELEEEAEETEAWIKEKCRYNPNILEDNFHLLKCLD